MGPMIYRFGTLWMFLMMLICLVIIVLVIVCFYKIANMKVIRDATTDDRAMDILKERYAKGEITDEEFNKKKQTIQSKQ